MKVVFKIDFCVPATKEQTEFSEKFNSTVDLNILPPIGGYVRLDEIIHTPGPYRESVFNHATPVMEVTSIFLRTDITHQVPGIYLSKFYYEVWLINT